MADPKEQLKKVITAYGKYNAPGKPPLPKPQEPPKSGQQGQITPTTQK